MAEHEPDERQQIDSGHAVVLTLQRQPNGSLLPFVDGKRIVGCMDTTVNTNGNQQVIQLVFHSSLVAFETAKNPLASRMN